MARQVDYFRRHITDTYLKRMRSNTDIQTMDTEIAGFHIRYSSNKNIIMFYLYYRMRISKKQNNVRIGQYGPMSLKDARISANEYKQMILQGIDPMIERHRRIKKDIKDSANNRIVSAVVDEYMIKYSHVHKKENSRKFDNVMIRNYVKPILGKMFITDLNLPTLIDFYNTVAKNVSFPSANHALAFMSGFWNWCETYEYLPLNTNPCKRVKKGKPAKKHIEVLDAPGYKKFMASTADGLAGKSPYDPRAFRAARIIALTGCRSSEITQLKKSEIKLGSERLDLQDSKTGARTVPLSTAAIEEIRKALTDPDCKNSEFLFPSKRPGVDKGLDIRKAFAWVLENAKLPHMRVHDLRHSFVTMGNEIGENTTGISRAVGHARTSTTEIYLHPRKNTGLSTTNNIANAIIRL